MSSFSCRRCKFIVYASQHIRVADVLSRHVITRNLTRQANTTPEALLEKSKERPDNEKGDLKDSDPQLTTGVNADRSKAPAQQDLGKRSIQRAQFAGGGSAAS